LTHILEFEPGLDKMLSKDLVSSTLVEHNEGIDFFVLPKTDHQNLPPISLLETDEAILNKNFVRKPDLLEKDKSTLAQVFPSVDGKTISNSSQDLVKSKAALITLLELAKTYISMEDFETAAESLQDVIMFGDKELQQEAQTLLARIKSKGI
jgi:FimV-like protein